MQVPTGIKGKLVRFDVNCNKGQIVGTFCVGSVTIHSIGQSISSFLHIEGITLGAGEEIPYMRLLEEKMA